MEPLESLRHTWSEMDEEARRGSLIAVALYGFFLLIGYRSLARTKDERLHGPRWLWRALMPSSAINVQGDQVTVVPIGVLAFWLLGRRRRKR